MNSNVHIYCNVTNKCTEIVTFDRVINGCMLIVTCDCLTDKTCAPCDNTFPPTPLNFPPSVYPNNADKCVHQLEMRNTLKSTF